MKISQLLPGVLFGAGHIKIRHNFQSIPEKIVVLDFSGRRLRHH